MDTRLQFSRLRSPRLVSIVPVAEQLLPSQEVPHNALFMSARLEP
jgi:hypothetical protein